MVPGRTLRASLRKFQLLFAVAERDIFLQIRCLEIICSVLDSESKDVLEFVLGLVEETVAKHSAEESLTLKDLAQVLLVESEKVTRVRIQLGVLNPL
ncbi:hypothetical protein VNO80_10541 [Phaseolus coccineus]|uniref:Uncharacterized protein n=1 Tax=Phaseolus coccineus TaxID=3886 RepID=A0AAN9N8K9_PHACN